MNGSRYIYDLLTLGTSFEQSIDGDKKSFTIKYIDWKNWRNNIFHVTEEYSVLRAKSREHYRPDIILFINGIPLVVIECKRPDIKELTALAEMKMKFVSLKKLWMKSLSVRAIHIRD